MYIPKTTYRIQFTSSFTFKDLEKELPYLEKLGIDTIYASPIFKAQPGSTHGYDVTDFNQLNPELGTMEEFESLIEKLHEKSMGWIQDIVPNHMAFNLENPYLSDVLREGRDSKHAYLFDIFWDHQDPAIAGKLMVPVLGDTLEVIVENEDLTLQFSKGSFQLNYYQNNYPLNDSSLQLLNEEARRQGIITNAEERPPEDIWGPKICNHVKAHPDLLQKIVQAQHYYLCHWQTTEKKINYRRFFTVNDLICLRQDDTNVFTTTHKLIADFCAQGYFQGIRVDHVDGLLKPTEYLRNLRNLLGSETYILVEKILGKNEELPEEWPIQGATGYNYLGAVNELLLKQEHEQTFTYFYHEFIGTELNYSTMVRRKKRFVLRQRMAGELDNLLTLLEKTSANPDPNLNYKEAITLLLISFPIYRTYIENQTQTGWPYLYRQIAEENQDLATEFEEIKKIFLLKTEPDLQFVMRFQQLSGPLAAKGVEDTAFYQYNRFIGQNEVGDEPSEFGVSVASFHEYISRRKEKWPLAMNNSSTHDTKRGEDTRARLAAISLDPLGWREFTREIDDESTGSNPVANDRYMILQALVGAWPLKGKIKESFWRRFHDFLQKALREGKNQTSWSSPNIHYENTCFSYSKKLLEDEKKRQILSGYVKKILPQGITNSINTQVLKFTLPGIPDLYQGCESWNFSFVDPDNRRPVNYKKLSKILNKLHALEQQESIKDFIHQLWNDNPADETLKVFVTQKLIQLRRSEQDLLVLGDYLPLESHKNAIAFLRHLNNQWLFVRLSFEKEQQTDLQTLDFPKGMPESWENIFTHEKVGMDENDQNFPFICLISR